MLTLEHYMPGIEAIRANRVPNQRLQDTHSAICALDHLLPLAIGVLARVTQNTGIDETFRQRLVHRGASFEILEMMLHGWPRSVITRALRRRIAVTAGTDSSAALAFSELLAALRSCSLSAPSSRSTSY